MSQKTHSQNHTAIFLGALACLLGASVATAPLQGFSLWPFGGETAEPIGMPFDPMRQAVGPSGEVEEAMPTIPGWHPADSIDALPEGAPPMPTNIFRNDPSDRSEQTGISPDSVVTDAPPSFAVPFVPDIPGASDSASPNIPAAEIRNDGIGSTVGENLPQEQTRASPPSSFESSGVDAVTPEHSISPEESNRQPDALIPSPDAGVSAEIPSVPATEGKFSKYLNMFLEIIGGRTSGDSPAPAAFGPENAVDKNAAQGNAEAGQGRGWIDNPSQCSGLSSYSCGAYLNGAFVHGGGCGAGEICRMPDDGGPRCACQAPLPPPLPDPDPMTISGTCTPTNPTPGPGESFTFQMDVTVGGPTPAYEMLRGLKGELVDWETDLVASPIFVNDLSVSNQPGTYPLHFNASVLPHATVGTPIVYYFIGLNEIQGSITCSAAVGAANGGGNAGGIAGNNAGGIAGNNAGGIAGNNAGGIAGNNAGQNGGQGGAGGNSTLDVRLNCEASNTTPRPGEAFDLRISATTLSLPPNTPRVDLNVTLGNLVSQTSGQIPLSFDPNQGHRSWTAGLRVNADASPGLINTQTVTIPGLTSVTCTQTIAPPVGGNGGGGGIAGNNAGGNGGNGGGAVTNAPGFCPGQGLNTLDGCIQAIGQAMSCVDDLSRACRGQNQTFTSSCTGTQTNADLNTCTYNCTTNCRTVTGGAQVGGGTAGNVGVGDSSGDIGTVGGIVGDVGPVFVEPPPVEITTSGGSSSSCTNGWVSCFINTIGNLF